MADKNNYYMNQRAVKKEKKQKWFKKLEKGHEEYSKFKMFFVTGIINRFYEKWD